MGNDHVAEPFRSLIDGIVTQAPVGNLFELQARSESLTIDVARKQMGNDVLRCLLATKALGSAAQVAAVIELCNAEARK
ncbi:MAG: hypothetical protein H7Z19_08205 [Chitinophagaceae bacterium]|nr:hypothetical protein [Rubrivivax sp.]